MKAETIIEKYQKEFREKGIVFDLTKPMIEFARYHVGKALEAALDSIPCLGSSTDIPSYEEVEDEVLNAYPLNNII